VCTNEAIQLDCRRFARHGACRHCARTGARSRAHIRCSHHQDRLCALRLRGGRGPYEPHCRGDACEHFAPPSLIQLRIDKGVYTSTLAVNSDTDGVLVDETYRYRGLHLSEYDRTKWIAHYRVAVPKMSEPRPSGSEIRNAIACPWKSSSEK